MCIYGGVCVCVCLGIRVCVVYVDSAEVAASAKALRLSVKMFASRPKGLEHPGP